MKKENESKKENPDMWKMMADMFEEEKMKIKGMKKKQIFKCKFCDRIRNKKYNKWRNLTPDLRLILIIFDEEIIETICPFCYLKEVREKLK